MVLNTCRIIGLMHEDTLCQPSGFKVVASSFGMEGLHNDHVSTITAFREKSRRRCCSFEWGDDLNYNQNIIVINSEETEDSSLRLCRRRWQLQSISGSFECKKADAVPSIFFNPHCSTPGSTKMTSVPMTFVCHPLVQLPVGVCQGRFSYQKLSGFLQVHCYQGDLSETRRSWSHQR
jgi:hypothetical protein